MALVVLNRNPSRRDLRWFGALFFGFTGAMGGLVYWKTTMPTVAVAVWILGALITTAYYAVPALRRPFYLAWMYAAFPIGWTISHLALVVIYYAVLTPTGIIARLAGHDPLHRRLDRDASTYWTRSRTRGDLARYFRQF